MPTIIILVGITGDLARRKLLPAIEALRAAGKLPEKFELVGVTRRENDQGYFVMDLDSSEDYVRLAAHLEDIERAFGAPAQRLFYLSVAPTVSLPIITHLGESGLAKVANTKLLIEKPFGTDYDNAKRTIDSINKHFASEQQYRIDHYLAKGSVRALAERPHNMVNVSHIEVLASEAIGIEGRADFYEQTGALRDLLQSHLLETLALAVDAHDRLSVLKGLSVTVGDDGSPSALRAQYQGYREEVGKVDSSVETFVSVPLISKSAVFTRTARLTTGKALAEKRTEITFTHTDGTKETIDLAEQQNGYENVFADAIADDHTYFVTPEEVLEDWRIVAPIQEEWKESSDDLRTYAPGADTDSVMR